MIHHSNHPLKDLTTLGVGGGVAEDFFVPESKAELLELIGNLHRKGRPYFLLGNGSNLFLASRRIRAPVIHTRQALAEWTSEEKSGEVRAGASVDIRTLINHCAQQGLRAPVELLTIPASLGGAIYMNAGRTSHRVTISDRLVSVEVFDGQKEFSLGAADCRFGYRRSLFHDRKDLTILGASFLFDHAPRERILADRNASLAAGADKCYRVHKSAGSVFRIYDAGIMQRLRGVGFTSATWAPKTSNCIINKGGAKAWQTSLLVKLAQLAHLLKKRRCALEIEIW